MEIYFITNHMSILNQFDALKALNYFVNEYYNLTGFNITSGINPAQPVLYPTTDRDA